MNISEAFPSKWLKSSDLQGKEIKLLMSNCEMETVGDDRRPVLYFKGKDKGMTLNKTNGDIIKSFYGEDTADWYDQPIILFAAQTEYQGKPMMGLRVRIPTAKDNKAAPKADPISSGSSRAAPAADMDDDIPF